MRTLAALLLFTISANAQQINNSAIITMQGTNQNVAITQSGGLHSATVDLRGNNLSFSGTQTGISAQSYSFSVDCGNSCPNSPYVINQY
jgi:hypothetical protein